jgi:hypothetical protein
MTKRGSAQFAQIVARDERIRPEFPVHQLASRCIAVIVVR